MGRQLIAVVLLFCFLLLSITAFPFDKPGSSIYYTSIAFFLSALFLASFGRGFDYGISYLLLVPKNKSLLLLALWGFAAFLSSIFVAAAASVALHFLGYMDAELVGKKISTLPPLALILAFSAAPIAEEALFRGYLFRKVSDALRSPILGALISSAIFASLHLLYGSVAEIVVAFLIAMVLCAFTQKTNSLYPAIISHSSFNFISIITTVFL